LRYEFLYLVKCINGSITKANLMVFYIMLKWNSSIGLYIMGHLWFIWKQAYLNWYMRHEVLHMEWSLLKSLLWNQCWWRCFHFMEFNVGLLFIQIMVWLGLACEVKIERKLLRRTKRRWRASDGLGTEGPWLWLFRFCYFLERQSSKDGHSNSFIIYVLVPNEYFWVEIVEAIRPKVLYYPWTTIHLSL
jgi:hypothetical protein